MMTENLFDYVAIDNLPRFEDALVGVVPAGIATHDDLLIKIEDELFFPSYFGRNWNALHDCLRDFHWAKQYQIVLVHQDIPALPAEQLQDYLEVLLISIEEWRSRATQEAWKAKENHSFRVVFDPSLKNQVALALRGTQ